MAASCSDGFRLRGPALSALGRPGRCRLRALSGELEFLNGDEPVTAGAGGFFFVPRGTRHRFLNRGYHAARMIFLFTPGGIEELLVASSTPATPGVAPTVQEVRPQPMAELMVRYATEQLPDPDVS